LASTGEKIGESCLPAWYGPACSGDANLLRPFLGEALIEGPATADSIAPPNGLSLQAPGALADLSWPGMSEFAFLSGGRPGIVAAILSIVTCV
jgi:hypothetical protein